ncbi:MAG TPA: hypothetical protein VKB03_05600 [Conexibacter sp.]|nr:hypothetical protein [Conexibacter sp.]
MHTNSKALMVGLAAAMLMAFAVGSASARNFSTSNQQIRSTFRSIEFSAEGLGTDRCDLTLEGSFHGRTMAKVPNSLIGYITRVSTANCTLTTSILSLPWHMRYVSFTGTLPNITLESIKIPFFFLWGTLGFLCLAEPAIEFYFLREAAGRFIGVDAIALLSFPTRSGGGFGCPSSTGSFRAPNNGTLTLLGTSNAITVTLI